MPKPYPQELSDLLLQQNVRFVVVGHTPHGNAPTVVQSNGVTIIMGDTSFSDMKPERPAFRGDTRGEAVSEIYLASGACGVRGRTEKGQIIDYKVSPCGSGDTYVGHMQGGDPPENRYFVKARLPPAPGFPEECYVLCNIQGFRYNYAILEEKHVRDNLASLGIKRLTKTRLSGCGKLGGLRETFLQGIFASLDRNRDGRVTRRELAAACTDAVVRDALLSSFPNMSLEQMFSEMARNETEFITLEEFRSSLRAEEVLNRHLFNKGIFFEVVQEASEANSGSMFPFALGPFAVEATRAICPQSLQLKASMKKATTCALPSGTVSEELLQQLPRPSQPLVSYLSPFHAVNLPEQARSEANIPPEAMYFAWLYPFKTNWGLDLPCQALSEDPDACLLLWGGFVYLDSAQKIIRINAIVPNPAGGLRFGPPKRFLEEWTSELRRSRRWRPVTLKALTLAGAREFCWLKPDEFIAGSLDADGFTTGPYGAFAYLGALEADHSFQ